MSYVFIFVSEMNKLKSRFTATNCVQSQTNPYKPFLLPCGLNTIVEKD